MSTIEIKSTVTFQDLLKGVEQLEARDLERFVEQVLQLRAKRLAPNLSEKEASLLEIINKATPKELLGKFSALDAKRKEENLSATEQEELIHISEKIESLNVDRMGALAKLAEIKQVPLDILAKE